MRRLRSQLARLGPAMAALFALGVAAPRAALIHHAHAHGDRAHVHSEAELATALLAELHERDHHHPHAHDGERVSGHRHPRSRLAPAAARRDQDRAPGGSALRADHGAAASHWHAQDRFHRGVGATAPAIAGHVAIVTLDGWAPTAATGLPLHELRARGPPAPLAAEYVELHRAW